MAVIKLPSQSSKNTFARLVSIKRTTRAHGLHVTNYSLSQYNIRLFHVSRASLQLHLKFVNKYDVRNLYIPSRSETL